MRSALLTALDQAVLSVVTFAAGLAFIYAGTPEQYGLFTFYTSVYYLLAAAQNALVNTPLMVLSPRMGPVERSSFERGALGILGVGMLLGLIFVPVASFFPTGHQGSSRMGFVVLAIGCLPLTLRDFFRSQEYARLQPARAFRRDLGYAGLALLGIGTLAMSGRLSGLSAFNALAIASLLIVSPAAIALARSLPCRSQVAAAFSTSWAYSRWSVVGATSSWLQANVFVLTPFLLAGSREVAFLAAARMAMTPMLLLVQSWSNYFRPRASRALSQSDKAGAVRLFIQSSLILSAILILYTLAVTVLLAVTPPAWIPAAYRGMNTYVWLWAAVSLVQVLRTNLSSLLQASLAFKLLAVAACAVAILVVAASVPLVWYFGGAGSLAAAIGGELLLTALLFLKYRRLFAGAERSRPAHALARA